MTPDESEILERMRDVVNSHSKAIRGLVTQLDALKTKISETDAEISKLKIRQAMTKGNPFGGFFQ